MTAPAYSSRTADFKPQTPQGDGNLPSPATDAPAPSNFKPQTPQGDGNERGVEDVDNLFHYFKLQTPQGDGNSEGLLLVKMSAGLISNHKPRKGTETAGTRMERPVSLSFQTTNPARGRKHFVM